MSSDVRAVSVVIPTFRESARILRALERLIPLGFHEILVVDASDDDTAQRAHSVQGVRVITSDRGRARQMNRGAREATGDTLLFLHADVTLPDRAIDEIERLLAKSGIVAGAFTTWTVDETRSSWLGPMLHLADVRSRITRLPYGDQALFVTAKAFQAVGGFPEQPLMEDIEIARKLRAQNGRIARARLSVRVSGRRFLRRPAYYTMVMTFFPLLYRLGVPPEVLCRWYGNPR